MTNGTRCVVVVDEALAPGLAANAAAVMAMTLGTKVPALVGDEFMDGAGETPPGPDHDRPAGAAGGGGRAAGAAREGARGRGRRDRLPALGPDDDRLRALPRDGRRDARRPTTSASPSTATARPCAASPAASGCCARCRGRSGSPTGSTRRSRRSRRGRSPRRRRSSGSARSPWPTAWPSRPCRARSRAARPAQANSSERIASAIGITASAGPGRTSIARPASSSVKPATTISTRRYSGRLSVDLPLRAHALHQGRLRRVVGAHPSPMKSRTSTSAPGRSAESVRAAPARFCQATRNELGSTALPPLGWISKCRCGGVGSASPVLPM